MRSLFRWCLLVVLATGFSSYAAEATVYISGKVMAKDSGKPLANVTVNLSKPGEVQPLATTTSLRNGSYVLKAPGAGIFRITADEVEHATLETTLNVPAAGLATYDIQLENLPSFRVHILGTDGAPDAGAVVQVWWSLAAPRDNKPALDKTTSADGELQLTAPHGVPVVMLHEIRIGIRDPQRGCGQRTVDSWPTEPVNISLQTGARLTGTVVDANEKPAPLVAVTATRFMGYLPTHEGEVTVTTNEAGQYDIPALFFGTYMVRANIPGVGLRAKQVVLSQPKTAMSLSPGDPQFLPPVFMPFNDNNPIPFLRRRQIMPYYRQRGPNGVPYTLPFPQIPQHRFPFTVPHNPFQPYIQPYNLQIQPGGPQQPVWPGVPGQGLLPKGPTPQKEAPYTLYALVPLGPIYQVQPPTIRVGPERSNSILLIKPNGSSPTPRLAPPPEASSIPRVTPELYRH